MSFFKQFGLDSNKMEHRKLIEALRATLDPNQRLQAEEQLGQVLYQLQPCGLRKMNNIRS